MKKYDAIIIGFGKGGKTLAADLANHGWNVAVVERSTGMYGRHLYQYRLYTDESACTLRSSDRVSQTFYLRATCGGV